VNYKIKDRFRNIIIDDNNNLFGLVTSQENPAQLVKYKLVFD
jgi:hypothetical protein